MDNELDDTADELTDKKSVTELEEFVMSENDKGKVSNDEQDSTFNETAEENTESVFATDDDDSSKSAEDEISCFSEISEVFSTSDETEESPHP